MKTEEIRITGFATVSSQEASADYARRKHQDDVLFIVIALPVLFMLVVWLVMSFRPRKH